MKVKKSIVLLVVSVLVSLVLFVLYITAGDSLIVNFGISGSKRVLILITLLSVLFVGFSVAYLIHSIKNKNKYVLNKDLIDDAKETALDLKKNRVLQSLAFNEVGMMAVDIESAVNSYVKLDVELHDVDIPELMDACSVVEKLLKTMIGNAEHMKRCITVLGSNIRNTDDTKEAVLESYNRHKRLHNEMLDFVKSVLNYIGNSNNDSDIEALSHIKSYKSIVLKTIDDIADKYV